MKWQYAGEQRRRNEMMTKKRAAPFALQVDPHGVRERSGGERNPGVPLHAAALRVCQQRGEPGQRGLLRQPQRVPGHRPAQSQSLSQRWVSAPLFPAVTLWPHVENAYHHIEEVRSCSLGFPHQPDGPGSPSYPLSDPCDTALSTLQAPSDHDWPSSWEGEGGAA